MSVVPIRHDGVIPATVSPPDKETISKLEDLLAKAISGQLRAIGYVMIDRDRAIGTGWAGHSDSHDMTAGVNMLAHRYMQCRQHQDDAT
jgi:hypothetical protein